jgi:hypothetical protein
MQVFRLVESSIGRDEIQYHIRYECRPEVQLPKKLHP